MVYTLINQGRKPYPLNNNHYQLQIGIIIMSQLASLKQELLSDTLVYKDTILEYEALSFNDLIKLRNKILNEIDSQQLWELDEAIGEY